MNCPVCGRALKPASKAGGRPRKYCSDRCKEKDKRKRNRDADRAAVLQARATLDPGADAAIGAGESVGLCHVCSRHAATVGTPEPLLCRGCAAPP